MFYQFGNTEHCTIMYNFALRLSPVIFNNADGIIQFQECSNVISTCRDVQSVQVRFQGGTEMILFDFYELCKFNMMGSGVGRAFRVKIQ